MEFPGAWWHVTNRGVEKRDIFLEDDDRRTFLRLIAEAVPRFRWRLHTYALMSNHFHLLVETIEPTLSRGMKKIEGDYARSFNKRHARVGHLFQARFRSHLIDTETYLLTAARYIVLNPVRAGIVRSPGEWWWSSYRATAGLTPAAPWLTTSSILDRFDPLDCKKAHSEYREYVGDVVSAAKRPWDDVVDRWCLGSREFVESMQKRIEERKCSDECVEKRATLDDIRGALLAVTGEGLGKSASAGVRMAFAELARNETLASLKDIGRLLGIVPSGVAYLIRQSERRRKADRIYAELIERLHLKIRN